MRKVWMTAALAGGLLAAGTASAGEWSGKGTLGGVVARGNTDSDTINANIDVQDVVAFMQGARPSTRPRPRPLSQEEMAPVQMPPGAAPAGGPASAQQNVQEIR